MPFSKKLARFSRRALLCIAVLATLLAAFFLIENWRGDRAWAAYEAEARSRGELQDAFPAPSTLPAARNFMRQPAFESVLFASNDSEEVKAYSKRLPLGALNFLQWNQGKRFDSAKFLAAQPGFKPVAGGHDAELRAAMAILSPIEDNLASMRAALKDRTESQAARPSIIDKEAVFEAPIPRFQIVRGLIGALTVDACAKLGLGQTDLACADTLASLRFSRGLTEVPDILLVEAMMGVVCSRVTLQSVWEATRSHAWTESQLEQIQRELGLLHPLRGLERGLRHERLMANSAMDGSDATALWFSLEDSRSSKRWNWHSLIIIPRGWLQQNKVTASRCMQYNIDVLKSGSSPAFLDTFAARDKAEALVSKQEWSTPYAYLACNLLSNYDKVIAHAAAAEAYVTLAKTACALERHRQDKGGYPDALKDLVPSYLSELPLDVIDGKPLRYHSDVKAGYRLYSIGLDGRDEGGRIEQDAGNSYTKGDWAWPE